jgi:hypothetical protein
MRLGRTHKWYYDKGEWKEKKLTPDKWQFTYNVTKRQAGNAPEGSGVPVGTEYHWYILANQNVKKLDANTYTTSMLGLKYKLAHKRPDKNNWSQSDNVQRKRLIEILRVNRICENGNAQCIKNYLNRINYSYLINVFELEG